MAGTDFPPIPWESAPAEAFQYCHRDGTPQFAILRYPAHNGHDRERFEAWTYGAVGWVKNFRVPPGSRVLFNLPEIDAAAGDGQPEPAVVIVQSEAAVMGSRGYVDGQRVVPVSWFGGVAESAIQAADWRPLEGRRVAIWPTNTPEGLAAAAAIRAVVPQATVIALPPDVPPGWDFAHPAPPNVTAGAISQRILETLFPPEKLPAKAPRRPIDPADAGRTEHPAGTSQGVAYIQPDKQIKPIMANIVAWLRDNFDRFPLHHDEFSDRPFLGTRVLEDRDVRAITQAIQQDAIAATINTVYDAVLRTAEQNHFHQVREYLARLQWDGIPRIDQFLIDHAGSPDTALTRAMCRKFLIQAVARVMDPGCQADAMLVLEGPQEQGKSSAVRAVFGKQWFTDHLPDLGHKDALLQLRGVWCVEIAELSTLDRAATAKIKQFLTSRVDRYRDPYGRITRDIPRQCVFIGTVNPGAAGYLRDETGGRRFWPIRISGDVDTTTIAASRDQYWAEALALYRAGEPWYLTDEKLRAAARLVQADRYIGDPWEEAVTAYVDGKDRVTLTEILETVLGRKPGEFEQSDQNRVSKILTTMGLVRRQRRIGKKVRWVYLTPEDAEQDPEWSGDPSSEPTPE